MLSQLPIDVAASKNTTNLTGLFLPSQKAAIGEGTTSRGMEGKLIRNRETRLVEEKVGSKGVGERAE